MTSQRSVVRLGLLLAVGLLAALFVVVAAPKAEAAYEAGRTIDDQQFLDARSMSIAEIQDFLVSKNSALKHLTFPLSCYGSDSRERQLYINAGATCDVPLPASHVIYYAAQIYGINPKVILATIQKEQSLATAPNPTSWQLNQAMGYACPTSGNCSGSSAFPWQIDNGTWALRYHFERARGNMSWWTNASSWTCGTQKHLYKPNLYPAQNVQFFDTNGTHYATVYIQNAATSSMYCYTPHAYNNPQGLYGRAAYGTTGLYYSGSYNFVYYYELWFGTTQGFSVREELLQRYQVLGGASGYGSAIDSGYCNGSHTVCWQGFRNGFIMYSAGIGAWESKGSIRAYWASIGYQGSKLGFPVGGEGYGGNGLWWQQYQYGFIIGSDRTGYWESMGKIRERWGQLGYQSSAIGLPVDREVRNSDGSGWQQYQNGFIIKLPGAEGEAWESKGAIRYYWGSIGYQGGPAGWPAASETYNSETQTWSQLYQNGTIHYSNTQGGRFVAK